MKTSSKTTNTVKTIMPGMVFIDKAAKREGYGRRFVVTTASATKSAQSVTCLSWYEQDGAPKKSTISVERLLADRDYSLLLSA